jgi:hypothetical protein
MAVIWYPGRWRILAHTHDLRCMIFHIASLAAFRHAPLGHITARLYHRSMVPIRKTFATLAWIGINYLLPNAY